MRAEKQKRLAGKVLKCAVLGALMISVGGCVVEPYPPGPPVVGAPYYGGPYYYDYPYYPGPSVGFAYDSYRPYHFHGYRHHR